MKSWPYVFVRKKHKRRNVLAAECISLIHSDWCLVTRAILSAGCLSHTQGSSEGKRATDPPPTRTFINQASYTIIQKRGQLLTTEC